MTLLEISIFISTHLFQQSLKLICTVLEADNRLSQSYSIVVILKTEALQVPLLIEEKYKFQNSKATSRIYVVDNFKQFSYSHKKKKKYIMKPFNFSRGFQDTNDF